MILQMRPFCKTLFRAALLRSLYSTYHPPTAHLPCAKIRAKKGSLLGAFFYSVKLVLLNDSATEDGNESYDCSCSAHSRAASAFFFGSVCCCSVIVCRSSGCSFIIGSSCCFAIIGSSCCIVTAFVFTDYLSLENIISCLVCCGCGICAVESSNFVSRESTVVDYEFIQSTGRCLISPCVNAVDINASVFSCTGSRETCSRACFFAVYIHCDRVCGLFGICFCIENSTKSNMSPLKLNFAFCVITCYFGNDTETCACSIIGAYAYTCKIPRICVVFDVYVPNTDPVFTGALCLTAVPNVRCVAKISNFHDPNTDCPVIETGVDCLETVTVSAPKCLTFNACEPVSFGVHNVCVETFAEHTAGCKGDSCFACNCVIPVHVEVVVTNETVGGDFCCGCAYYERRSKNYNSEKSKKNLFHFSFLQII